MSDDYGQLHWQGCVEQAIQDIRLLVDAANDLCRAVRDAKRNTAATPYHVFAEDVDVDELVRTASSLKNEIGTKVGSIRDRIRDLIAEVAELGEIAQAHQSSV